MCWNKSSIGRLVQKFLDSKPLPTHPKLFCIMVDMPAILSKLPSFVG